MARIVYPEEEDFRVFIHLITRGNYRIKKYLPVVDDEWYRIMIDCVNYVSHTSQYEKNLTIHQIAANLLYKVAKRHELNDGNKRSGVMCVVLFGLVNDYGVTFPERLKCQAKRIASTKGRNNEDLMRRRVAVSLETIMSPIA